MKKENGLSMIALILIVVVIGVIVFTGVKYIQNYIRNEKNEDIKTAMLLIQGKITEIANKHTVNEEENALVGSKLDLASNEIEYKISDELKEILKNLENADLYILTEEDLKNMSVKDVEVNHEEFYIVDYNSEEVFYSLGIDGQYRVTDFEKKKKDNEEQSNNEVEAQVEQEPGEIQEQKIRESGE